MIPTCSQLFAFTSLSRLSFDQNPNVITPTAQQVLNEAFKADFLYIASIVKS